MLETNLGKIMWLNKFLPQDFVAQVATTFNVWAFDASTISISTDNTNATPSTHSGMLAVTLYRDGTIIASTSFPWVRNTAGRIVVADPGAVNAWLRTYPQLTDYEITVGGVNFVNIPRVANVVADVYSGGELVTAGSTSAVRPSWFVNRPLAQ
jgi:hypothetical protein